MAADAKRQREIYAYWAEGEKYFKFEPSKCLYCLQWQHRGHPPDFNLQLVKDELQVWVPHVSAALLAELRKLPEIEARLRQELSAGSVPSTTRGGLYSTREPVRRPLMR